MNWKIKYTSTVSILIVLLLSNPLTFYTVQNVDAQQVKLIVSAAQDPRQKNTFFGPQIVQIIVDDASARDPDTSIGGLLVKGQQTQRVHLADGRWYSFIAQTDSFLLLLDLMTDGVRDNRIFVSDLDDADNRNTIGAISITFGIADSFVREITEVGNDLFVEVKKNDIFPTLPDPFTGAGAVNPDLNINSSSEAAIDWPYIKLIDIQETDIVDIRLDNTSVSLTYAKHYSDIQVKVDRESYPLDSEVIATFKDFMWNINPVEEDVVRFVLDKNSGVPNRIIYQPIRNFDPAANSLNLINILPAFTLLEFDSRQVMEVANVQNLKYKEAFSSTGGTVVVFPEQSGRLINAMASAEFPMITFIEREPNKSTFESIDAAQGGRSNIFGGVRDSSTSFDYFDIIASASIISTHDAFATVDKEIYDSGVRATFTITDQDLNVRSRISETHTGIQSKAFVSVGKPFPLTNNGLFNTLPKDATGNFVANSIQAVRFNAGPSGTAVETVDSNQDGTADFSAEASGINNRSPTSTDFLALDFTTESIAGNLPTGFIINSDVKLSDIAGTTTFTMTKQELLDKADPFIRAVSNLQPQASVNFETAANNEQITVTFPRYNLVNIDLSRLNAVFAKVFVEIEAQSGNRRVSQLVDFSPFDAEDVDGDATFQRDALVGNSGLGSFRVPDFINFDWNGDGITGDAADTALLSNISLKLTVIITDSTVPGTPIPITSARHQVALDVGGLGVIRAEGETVDRISVDASEHLVYRLELKEQSENSNKFSGRTDFMTVLHNDTVQGILREIRVTGDPLKIWMPNRFIPPNRLALSYTDLDISGTFRQVSTTFLYETRDGEISWDRDQYRFSQVAILTVKDADLNRKPDAVERYTIPRDGFLFFEFGRQRADTQCANLTPIPDTCLAKFVEATLQETAPNSSEFTARITMPQNVLLASGVTVKTFQSDIRAVYVDPRDSSSNVNEFSDSAVIRSGIDTSAPQQAPITKNPAVVEMGKVRIELDKPDYHPNSRVYITITAKDKNTDKFRSDIIFIKVARLSDNTGLNYKLVETEISSGVFTGYVDLRGPNGRDGGVGPKDGRLKIDANDTLKISFEQARLEIPIQYNEGKVFWGKSRYVIGEKAKLQAIEPDMNKNADITEVLKVTLQINNAKVPYELRETEPNSGMFEKEIPFVDSAAKILENEVGVTYGDTVIAVYKDATVPEALKDSVNANGALLVKASIQIGDVVEFVGVNRIAQTDYRLVDENGNAVTNPSFRNSYTIESKVHNNTEQSLQFEYIVQITDEDGFVVFFELITQNTAPNDTIIPSMDWKPPRRGKYIVEIFVWQDLDLPSPLSSVMKSDVVVV